MEFSECLARQARLHPSMRPQDAVKLCFQAAFGAEHLLEDIDAARRWFDDEFQSTPPADGELFEQISPDFCRVNLAVWKREGLPREKLFGLFCATAAIGAADGGDRAFAQYLRQAGDFAGGGGAPFSAERWRDFVEGYLAGGIRAIHHSDEYRAGERPAYRVVSMRCADEMNALIVARQRRASRLNRAGQART